MTEITSRLSTAATNASRAIQWNSCYSRRLLLSTWIVFAACTPPTPDLSRYTERHSRVAFHNANVVHPERNEVVRGQTVYVEDGRIVSVAPPGVEPIPPDAYAIDAVDAYLLPGLGDMHVHHYPVYDDADLLLYLVNGVTTVRFGTSVSNRTRSASRAAEITATTLVAPDGSLVGLVTPSSVGQAVLDGVESPNYAGVMAPALGIYAVAQSADDVFAWLTPTSPDWGAAETYVATVIAPAREAERVRFDTEVPNSTVLELDGANHYVFLWGPDQVAAAVLDFLGVP